MPPPPAAPAVHVVQRWGNESLTIQASMKVSYARDVATVLNRIPELRRISSANACHIHWTLQVDIEITQRLGEVDELTSPSVRGTSSKRTFTNKHSGAGGHPRVGQPSGLASEVDVTETLTTNSEDESKRHQHYWCPCQQQVWASSEHWQRRRIF